MEDTQSLREAMRQTLELLSDRDAQASYEAAVPLADVPAELVAMWFDDLYLPDSALFARAFSAEEKESFAAFNGVYESHLSAIPRDGGVAALHDSLDWIQVMTAAQVVLDSYDPHS